MGRALFETPSLVDLNPDLAKERKDAEAWVRITFNLPAETDLSGPGTLATDARFIRGTELWEMGMYDEARLEFESLRESVSTSPADSFRLGNHLLGIGLYRSAIFAMRQVLTLAGQLDKAWGLEPNSRLGCQALVRSTSLVVEIPKYSINMAKEGHRK